MHCVAGDGVGILAGAVLSSVLGITGIAEMVLEYVLGFAFGWTIFQALFMRDMAGGTYLAALKSTFMAELLSMNLLMAGMMPTMMILRRHVEAADNPLTPNFWFVMSMALLVGFIVAYPMNWWLVANHLKHGMMTVRPATAGEASMSGITAAGPSMSPISMPMETGHALRPPVAVMALLSFLALAAGLAIAVLRGRDERHPRGAGVRSRPSLRELLALLYQELGFASCSAMRSDISSSSEAPEYEAACSTSPRRLSRRMAMRLSSSVGSLQHAGSGEHGRLALRGATAFLATTCLLRVAAAFLLPPFVACLARLRGLLGHRPGLPRLRRLLRGGLS